MTEDQKKVEFRIRYSQKTPDLVAQQKPRLITEWHYGRIIGGVVILVIIAVVTITSMTGSKTLPEVITTVGQKTEPSQVAVNNVSKQPEMKSQRDTPEPKANKQTSPTPSIVTDKTLEAQTEQPLSKHTTTIFSLAQTIPTDMAKLVLRSQLALGMWETEPFGNVPLPVKVNSTEATGLFYFTEIAGLQGQSVYHVWQHDGKTIFQQKKYIASKRIKTYTSKLFTMASIGTWTVSLTDSEFKPLHTIQFNVVAEEQFTTELQ